MTGNTGLLTARCDPYGAESAVKLMGGLYPESHRGRHMWHCSAKADARYRMECTGGEYGLLVPRFSCPGGHKGQVMPLCNGHRAEIAKRQAGLCPACAYPPQARMLTERLEGMQTELYYALQRQDLSAYARGMQTFNDMRKLMDEYNQRGLVHRCPLRLVEVS